MMIKSMSPLTDAYSRSILKRKVKEMREDIKGINSDFEMDAEKSANALTSLKFVSSINYEGHELEILTNELIVKMKLPVTNFGRYLITFPDVMHEPKRFLVKRIEGPVYMSYDNSRYMHPCVTSDGGMCLGCDKTYNQFVKFAKMGRFDLALQIVWNLLQLTNHKNSGPYVDHYSFAEALASQKGIKVKKRIMPKAPRRTRRTYGTTVSNLDMNGRRYDRMYGDYARNRRESESVYYSPTTTFTYNDA